MPQGLQLFNPDTGLLRLDVSTHVGRFLGSFSTNGQQTGSITDSRIIGYRFFYIGFGGASEPEISPNTANGIISWTYTYYVTGSYNPPNFSNTVYYGVF